MRKSTVLTVVSFALVTVPVLSGAVFVSTGNEQVQTCMVEGKDRSTAQRGGSIYEVYTSCGVFHVEDNFLKGVFDSVDLYAGIEVDETYEFTTLGWCIPVLSSFPRVVAVDQV